MNNLEVEQNLLYNTIKNIIDKGMLPHALIFYGDKSTSKLEMALFLVKYLYSKVDGVDKEIINKRIDDNSLTNLFIIEGDNGTVKKAQVIDIIKESSKSSLEVGPKVFIFKDADHLNQSSANSLLKFIEEPIDDTYIIFLATNLNNIIPTIKSRCQIFNFKPLNKESVKEKISILGLDKELENVLIEYSLNIDDIKKYSESEEYMSVYAFLKGLFDEEYEKKGSMLLYYNEHEKVLSNDEYKEFFITLLIYYLNDILKAKSFNGKDMLFVNSMVRINELSHLYSVDDILSLTKEALDIKVKMKYRINFKLNMDKLLLDIEDKAQGDEVWKE